jgi:hypothetical protein
LNNNSGDDEEKMAKVRLLTELMILAMEDAKFEIKCLQKERIEDNSIHFKASIDALNKAQYYIGQLALD